MVATGAGAGSRVALGTAVFGGMLAATIVGILLIPVTYFVIQSIREKVKGVPRDAARSEPAKIAAD